MDCVTATPRQWRFTMFQRQNYQILTKVQVSCALYLDLSCAFDTVSSEILLKKLEHYGIHGVPLQLIQNYLSNRQQCVNINGVLSSLLSVEIGVPQGSVLGYQEHQTLLQNYLPTTLAYSLVQTLLLNFNVLPTMKFKKLKIG